MSICMFKLRGEKTDWRGNCLLSAQGDVGLFDKAVNRLSDLYAPGMVPMREWAWTHWWRHRFWIQPSGHALWGVDSPNASHWLRNTTWRGMF